MCVTFLLDIIKCKLCTTRNKLIAALSQNFLINSVNVKKAIKFYITVIFIYVTNNNLKLVRFADNKRDL